MAAAPDKRAEQATPALDGRPFLEGQSEARARYGRFNLGIVGGTGVGKSSLINAVFGRDLAKTGKGLPVTRGVEYFHDASLGIWDFEGFEIGSQETPAQSLRRHLHTIAQGPTDQQISVIWYCLLGTADRLTPTDIDLIRELDASGLPVVLVLTKVAWTKQPITGHYRAPKDVQAFADWLEHPVDANGAPIHLPVQAVVLTSAHGKGSSKSLGDLVTTTLNLSPDGDKDAFRIAQRLNLPWKRELARPVVATASAAAAAVAATPLPIADAITLAPIQLTMMGRIATIYDLELTTMMSATALAQLSTQIAGQALARSFIKLIPGAGNAVNAAVAFALTGAVGEAWMRLCERVHTGDINPGKIAQAWGDYAPTAVSVVRKLVEQRAAKPKL